MYLFKIDSVLLGAYWELTMIPSFVLGVVFPFIAIIKIIKQKTK